MATTVTVDERDAERLQKLHPDHQAAVMEEYAERTAAAGGSSVPPAIQRQLMQQALEKVANDEDAADRRRQQEAGLHLDLVEPAEAASIGGRKCRPFTAGVVVILEAIAHPILEADEGEEMTLQDLIILLFVFLCESDRELVKLSRQGADAMAEEALAWSFGLGMPELEAMGAQAMAMIDRCNHGEPAGNPQPNQVGTG